MSEHVAREQDVVAGRETPPPPRALLGRRIRQRLVDNGKGRTGFVGVVR